VGRVDHAVGADARGGRREDLGGRYFRSRWEANWARYLDFLVANRADRTERWEYEPDTFTFPVGRGTTSYTPDFKVWERGKPPVYQEVKGWMDPQSRVRLRRMAQHYPDVTVQVVDQAAYREVERKLGRLIRGWEFGEDPSAAHG
jgi:hypothetical protein